MFVCKVCILISLSLIAHVNSFLKTNSLVHNRRQRTRSFSTTIVESVPSSVFNSPVKDAYHLKSQILQLGAALDRGTSYNPTSGEYYKEKMDVLKAKIASLCEVSSPAPLNLSSIDGEWELVASTVSHGIFRSSPFFLAIQEAYHLGGEAGTQIYTIWGVHGYRTPTLTLVF